MKQSSSFFFLARPSRFTVSLAAAALIGGVCFGARAMARQTPTPVTPASGVPVPPAPKPADPPTRPVGTAPTDAAKPPLVLRGVTSDGAGDLGFGERGHTTPDLGDLPPSVRSAQTRAYERGPRGLPGSASGWANRGLTAAQSEDYATAAESFGKAADIYDAKGDSNTALVMRAQASRYTTELRLYFSRKPTLASVRAYDTGRRLEPVYGTYIGAFIDHDDSLEKHFMDGDRKFRDAGEFNEKIGRKHASFFTYNGYGGKIPTGWFSNLRENGAAAQWCIEPNRLDDVRDDETLHNMARAARDAKIPIFVRFASEMNGNWTPYHAPAALYREKFRLVAKVFHDTAPNVAMVWCPNNLPENSIAEYYPGEDATDWVGVNFYSTYYNNNDAKRPVWWRNPADNLDFIYKRYAAKHPILVGEWAATHNSQTDGVIRADFAVNKIGQLYSAIPRKYPRVKAVHWFDMNSMRYAAVESRKTNDYTLLSDPKVAAQYKEMVSSGYYLDTPSTQTARAMATEEIVPLADKTPVSGVVTLSAWVKTYEERPTVTVSVRGKAVKTFTVPGTYEYALDTTALPNGPVPLTVSVRDSKGRTAVTRTVTLRVANGVGGNTPPTPVVHPTPPVTKTKIKPAALTPASGSVTLANLLARAETNPARLSLTRTPDGEKISITDRLRFRIGVGAPGYLFVFLRRDSGDAAGEEILLSPRVSGLAGGNVDGAKVASGDTAEIPKDARRALSPDAPGMYRVRAYLFADAKAARAFAASLTAGDSPAVARRRIPVPSGMAVPVLAESSLEVIAGGR